MNKKHSTGLPDRQHQPDTEKEEDTRIIQILALTTEKYYFWILLAALIHISAGIAFMLTLYGIVAGWISIWMGIFLFCFLNKVRAAIFTGRATDLLYALTRLLLYFKLFVLLNILIITLYFAMKFFLTHSIIHL